MKNECHCRKNPYRRYHRKAGLYRVKGGITEESFRVDQRMCTKKILKGGDQKPCVVDRFIFIRRNGCFLNDDIRMFLEKVLIVKSKMADNTKAVYNNTDFVGIAKVAVNEELLYLRAGSIRK